MNAITLHLSRTYTALLFSRDWERSTKGGQALLVSLREYIAKDLGKSPQEVQEGHEEFAATLQFINQEWSR